MLTSGCIKTESVSMADALITYRRKPKLISLIMLIIGAVGLFGYMVLAAVLETAFDESPLWIDAFLVFAFPFTLGLIGFITMVRLNRSAKKHDEHSCCVFYADCFFYNGEKLGYGLCSIKREIQNYGYIFAMNGNLFLPFSTTGLSETELNTVRALFRQSVSGECVQLEKFSKEG